MLVALGLMVVKRIMKLVQTAALELKICSGKMLEAPSPLTVSMVQ